MNLIKLATSVLCCTAIVSSVGVLGIDATNLVTSHSLINDSSVVDTQTIARAVLDTVDSLSVILAYVSTLFSKA